MAEIVINGNQLINGKFTIIREAKDNEIVTHGHLITHRYFEEIHTLETDRYRVKGVRVFVESFGSDDFNIVYEFTAKELDVKFEQSNLTDREIEAMEKKIYGGETNE